MIDSLGFAETIESSFWSYDNAPFTLRQNSEQVYLEMPVFGLKRRPQDIKSEALLAAKAIQEKWTKPTILYSGGIDSEVVLLSFLLQKIPVEVVIVDLLGKNRMDTERAVSFCNKHQVSYKIHTFDVLKYWENDLWQDAQKISCASPQIMAHCKIVEQIGNYVIVGGGDSHLIRAKKQFFETSTEKWALARWMLYKNIPGCPRFFQYTKSLEAAFLFEPMVEQFVNDAWPFFEFRKFMYLKPFIFNKYFNCELRQKLTGFEEIIDICDDYRLKLAEVVPVQNEISWSYENAKLWALSECGPSEYLPLESSPITDIEKERLSDNDIKSHFYWLR